MSSRKPLTLTLLAAFLLPVIGNGTALDKTLAEKYFKSAARLSQRDGGDLWGMELYGPMMFVDRSTREMVANQPDTSGLLQPDGELFTGELPEGVPVANTALDWGGKRWTMIMWPPPEKKFARNALLMHESFHRIQDRIGIPSQGTFAPYLNKEQGRILIRLEWEALLRAIQSSGDDRKHHFRNALVFRHYRHQLFAGADILEQQLELNEGLAEYTGVVLSGRDSEATIRHLSNIVARAIALPTLVRSFPYISGPLYGVLLDGYGSEWREEVKKLPDLGKLLLKRSDTFPLKVSGETVLQRQRLYSADSILAFERERAKQQAEEIRKYRQIFTKNPILSLPLMNKNVRFDPRGLTPLDSLGTVYSLLIVTEPWGKVVAREGALLTPDWTKVLLNAGDLTLPVSSQSGISLHGWELTLNPGWVIIRGNQGSAYTVTRQE